MTPEVEEPKPSKMRDAFVSFILFFIVTVLTHGFGGSPPFVLPSVSKSTDGVPAAAAPPNLRVQVSKSEKKFLCHYCSGNISWSVCPLESFPA
jgi:hypothetical protein